MWDLRKFEEPKWFIVGSYAEGTATKESDLDVVLWLPNAGNSHGFEKSPLGQAIEETLSPYLTEDGGPLNLYVCCGNDRSAYQYGSGNEMKLPEDSRDAQDAMLSGREVGVMDLLVSISHVCTNKIGVGPVMQIQSFLIDAEPASVEERDLCEMDLAAS